MGINPRKRTRQPKSTQLTMTHYSLLRRRHCHLHTNQPCTSTTSYDSIDPTLGCGSLMAACSSVNNVQRPYSPSDEDSKSMWCTNNLLWQPTMMNPSAAICLFIRFICLWSKYGADALLVEGVLAATQPFFSTHYKQVILQIINNLVYYFNMWHVSTPYPHYITIKWFRGSVIAGC